MNEVNIWDWGDFWKLLSGTESPREMLYRYVLESLFKPKQVDLYTEQYFRVLSFFATLLLPMLLIGLVATAIQCVTRRSSEPLKQWAFAAAYLLGFVVVAPGVFTFGQYLFTLIGSGVATMLLNTNDPEAALKILTQLTGQSMIDNTLSLVEIVLLVILALLLLLVQVALYTSTIACMLGLTLRFVPWIGEPLFSAAMKITIFGMLGYCYVLLSLSIVVGGGRALVGDNAFMTGLLNVLAIVVSVLVLWKASTSLFEQLRTVFDKAVEGYQAARGKMSSKYRSSGDGGENGPSKAELDNEEASDHLKGTRRGHGSTSSPDSIPTDPTKGTSGAEGVPGKGTPTDPTSGTSAAAKRLATEAAKKVPEPEVQAAARAAETAEKVRAGAEAAREGNPAKTTVPTKGQHPAQADTDEAVRGLNNPSQPARPDAEESGSRRHGSEKSAAQKTAEDYQRQYRHPQPPPESPSASPSADSTPRKGHQPTPRHEREPERTDDS